MTRITPLGHSKGKKKGWRSNLPPGREKKLTFEVPIPLTLKHKGR